MTAHEPNPFSAAADSTDQFQQQLLQFRAQIDGMDDELIALIKKRCEVVQKVGHLKENFLDARCFIRPGREATMLKRIAEQFGDHSFSSGAAAAIWRLVIAASTSIEQPLKITSYFSPTQQDGYWLAREYFGMFTNVTKETAPSRVIGQLMDGAALVGILPALDSGTEDAWWKLLMDSDAASRPNIFACLPFACVESPAQTAGSTPRPIALAAGFVDCEKTGDDVTYLAIDGKHDLSQSRIHSHFASAGENARWLQVLQSPASDSRLHLIELDGFFTQESPVIASLQDQLSDQLHRLTILGAHAKPILLAN